MKDFFKKFKRNIGEAWQLIKINFKQIVIFVALFTLIGGMLAATFCATVRDLSRRIAGVPFIGDYSIAQYYFSPVFIISAIVLLIVITYISMIEIGALTRAIRLSKHGEKAGLKDMLREGLNDACRFLHPKNWLFSILISLIIPLFHILSVSNIVIRIEIPEFILDFIVAKPVLYILSLIVVLVITIIFFRFIYSIRIFADTEKSFFECCRDSVAVMKGNFLRTLITLLLADIAVSAVILGIGSIIGICIYRIMTYFNSYNAIDGSAVDTAKDIIVFASYIQAFLMPAINLAILSAMYYDICGEKEIAVTESVEGLGLKKSTAVTSSIAIIVLVICFIVSFNPQRALSFMNLKTDRPDVAAHRGDSVRCPENSMPAFLKAIDEGADWIELDVHQSKDGVIIVSHDENLERICGKDVNVHELTYDELMKLEVGSWFDEEYDGLRLSTLDEVLKECKGNLNVQIEIKPTEYDRDIEQAVVDIVKANGMTDDVVILSLATEPLEKVEEICPDITTMYCTVIAYGDVEDAPADWLSVEAENVDHTLVEDVHDAGKKIFAWTVNDYNKVQHMIDCGVDGILTDDPVMMDTTLEQSDYDGRLLSRIVDMISTWVIRF